MIILKVKLVFITVFPIELQQCNVQIEKMTILDKIDLEINVNDRVLIMGPSGSGKSTLLELIYGLYVSKDGVQSIMEFRDN